MATKTMTYDEYHREVCERASKKYPGKSVCTDTISASWRGSWDDNYGKPFSIDEAVQRVIDDSSFNDEVFGR